MTQMETTRGRRLRKQGVGVLVTMLLLLLAAWNTGTNLLYVVLGGLCSFLVISVLLAGWSLRRVRVGRDAPEAVHRDEPFPIVLRIENHKRLVPAFSIRATHGGLSRGALGRGQRSHPADESTAFILKIPPQRAAVVRVSEQFPRRGVHRLPPVLLASGFPFGFFEKRLRAQDSRTVVVYPRVRPVRPSVVRQLSGVRAVPRIRRGDSDEFFSLRDYVAGDDVRQVAWRVSARRGNLVVREFAHGICRSITLVLDTTRRGDIENFEERFEDAVELAASLAITFLNQQYSVAVVTCFSRLPEGEGSNHGYKALDLLARVEAAESVPPGFAWFTPTDDIGVSSHVFVSPDSREWGRTVGPYGRVIDPKEVVYA